MSTSNPPTSVPLLPPFQRTRGKVRGTIFEVHARQIPDTVSKIASEVLFVPYLLPFQGMSLPLKPKTVPSAHVLPSLGQSLHLSQVRKKPTTKRCSVKTTPKPYFPSGLAKNKLSLAATKVVIPKRIATYSYLYIQYLGVSIKKPRPKRVPSKTTAQAPETRGELRVQTSAAARLQRRFPGRLGRQRQQQRQLPARRADAGVSGGRERNFASQKNPREKGNQKEPPGKRTPF